MFALLAALPLVGCQTQWDERDADYALYSWAWVPLDPRIINATDEKIAVEFFHPGYIMSTGSVAAQTSISTTLDPGAGLAPGRVAVLGGGDCPYGYVRSVSKPPYRWTPFNFSPECEVATVKRADDGLIIECTPPRKDTRRGAPG